MELRVARDERGVALASAGSWEASLTAVRDLGASAPRHIVSDGDRAIESAISIAYGRGVPHHQLCQYRPLREYKRNIAVWDRGRQRRCLDPMIWSKRGSMPNSGIDGREGVALAIQGIAKRADASANRRC